MLDVRASVTDKFGLLLLALLAGTLLGVGAYYAYITRNDDALEEHAKALLQRAAAVHRRIDNTAPLSAGERQDLRAFVHLIDTSLQAYRDGGTVDGRLVGPVSDGLQLSVREADAEWQGTRAGLLAFVAADPGAQQAARERAHRTFPAFQNTIDRLSRRFELRRTALGSLMRSTFLVICAINGGFLIIGLWATNRLIIRPVRLLEAGARRVAAGDYSHSVPVVTNDEIGQLAASFNTMSRELAKSIAALNTSERALEGKAIALERTNAELEQYAYAASHDLQEPLRVIVMYSQLLRKRAGRLEENAEICLSHIETGAQRMQRLIADLLSYSSVLNESASVPVDTNAALQAAIRGCSLAVAEASGQIRFTDLPPVLASATEIELVFQNLITNAVKYRSETPPVIDITAAVDGLTCTFRVSDNGIGIRPEYHDRIFDLFKRLHGREVAGTGVGLALTRRIVEKHGGRIWVESDEGRGATFMFTLPLPSALHAAATA